MSVLDELEQAETWTSTDGTVHRLRDMPRRHKLNVLRWIRSRAASLALAHDLAESGEYGHGYDALFACDEWIERRPLVRKLVELVGNDEDGPIVRRTYQCGRCRSGRLRLVLGAVDYFDVAGTAGEALVVRGGEDELARLHAADARGYLACRECTWSGPLPSGIEVVGLPQSA